MDYESTALTAELQARQWLTGDAGLDVAENVATPAYRLRLVKCNAKSCDCHSSLQELMIVILVLLTGVGPTDIVRRDTAVPMPNSYDVRALGNSFTADVDRDKYFKSCEP
jgi:hypothetical protein